MNDEQRSEIEFARARVLLKLTPYLTEERATQLVDAVRRWHDAGARVEYAG